MGRGGGGGGKGEETEKVVINLKVKFPTTVRPWRGCTLLKIDG